MFIVLLFTHLFHVFQRSQQFLPLLLLQVGIDIAVEDGAHLFARVCWMIPRPHHQFILGQIERLDVVVHISCQSKPKLNITDLLRYVKCEGGIRGVPAGGVGTSFSRFVSNIFKSNDMRARPSLLHFLALEYLKLSNNITPSKMLRYPSTNASMAFEMRASQIVTFGVCGISMVSIPLANSLNSLVNVSTYLIDIKASFCMVSYLDTHYSPTRVLWCPISR